MGLKERFAKPSVPDSEPVLRDRSTILACLEELCRLRTPISIWLDRDDLLPVTARVELVGEETDTLTLSLQRALPGEIDPRFPLELLFPLDGMRFRCALRFRERGGYMKAVFKLPEAVLHAERREKVRTRFGQRENASATVLESLFRGHGVSGKLLNLSMEGFCMRLDKAMSIQENRRMTIHSSLFHARQELMVVRLLDIPHAPLLECPGLVMHIEDGPEGVTMGVHLAGLGAQECQILADVMTRRVPTFSRGFPQKRRRCELDLEGPDRPAEAPIEAPEAIPAPVCSGSGTSGLDSAESASNPQDRLERMRKRARHILIVKLDDLNRAILAGTLLADGFTNICEARNFIESIQAARKAPIDLILIEQQIGAIPAQQFLDHLRKAGHCEHTPVILLADQIDVKTTIMAKAAGIKHIQPQPIDYDGELAPIVYDLLRIKRG